MFAVGSVIGSHHSTAAQKISNMLNEPDEGWWGTDLDRLGVVSKSGKKKKVKILVVYPQLQS